jgi:glycosyltransferase involved in cell wall biosynthesis
MDSMLAIVIPAFKKTFFVRTLQSIANQTNRNFVLYIGNDAGDKEIQNIVLKYIDQIKIVYKEFDTNLGKESLIKHWSRCVEMVANEKYIWFFSDDDAMDAECVEKFYETLIQTKELFDVYRFDTRMIGSGDEIVFENLEHPEFETSNEFAQIRLGDERMSAACEYIFRLQAFNGKGGFVDFPMAWCSDDATWIKLASDTGIKTIKGPKVSWRTSSQSISGSSDNKAQKISALKKYLLWYNGQSYLLQNSNVRKKQKCWMFKHYFKYLNRINIFDWLSLLKFLSGLHNDGFLFNVVFLIRFIKNNKHIAFKY